MENFTSVCIHVEILPARVKNLEVYIRLSGGVVGCAESPYTRGLEA